MLLWHLTDFVPCFNRIWLVNAAVKLSMRNISVTLLVGRSIGQASLLGSFQLKKRFKLASLPLRTHTQLILSCIRHWLLFFFKLWGLNEDENDASIEAYTPFFIRTSKFDLRLNVLIQMLFWGSNVLKMFLFQTAFKLY